MTLPEPSGQSPASLLPFLLGNVSLIVGAALALILVGLRASAEDRELRRDLEGALFLLSAFLVFRFVGWLAPPTAPIGLLKALRVAWMLTFAFAVIRTSVAIGLRVVRLRTRVTTPKILRNVIDFSLYALVAVPILQSQLAFDLTGLVATSAVLSVVIGLALQETLGNLFAGLSLQLQRPFQVGDFVTIGQHTGRVVQMAWRATRLETGRRESITVPNSLVAKEAVQNYSRAAQPIGTDIYLGLSYDAPPNTVKALALEVMKEISLVLKDPPPLCRTWAYEDAAIRYQLRYFVASFTDADLAKEEILSRLWYRLRRASIELPFPQRTLQVRPESLRAAQEAAQINQLLRSVDLFKPMAPQDVERLGQQVVSRTFGKGERILTQGAEGDTFYLIASGEVSVRTGKHQVEVARLRRGQYFGEMSLLTGEMRSATVVAEEDSVLLELARPVFARLFAEQPVLAKQLSSLLAERRSQLRTLSEPASPPLDSAPEAGRILNRLRHIFGLAHD